MKFPSWRGMKVLPLCLPLLLAVSCSGTDILPDKASMSRFIQKADDGSLNSLLSSSEARAKLDIVFPGAEYYIGLGLQAQGKSGEASRFFADEVAKPSAAWKLISFEAWLSQAQASGNSQEILGTGQVLYSSLDPASFSPENFARISALWNRAQIDALIQSGRIADARTLSRSLLSKKPTPTLSGNGGGSEANADQSDVSDSASSSAADSTGPVDPAGPSGLGTPSSPSWLLFDVAKLALLTRSSGAAISDAEILSALAPYVLEIPAEAGHVEILGLLNLSSGISAVEGGTRPELKDSPETRALGVMLGAKAALSSGDAPSAYDGLRQLTEVADNGKPGAQSAGLRQGFLAFSARTGNKTFGFFRDLFDAARLSGKITDGAMLLSDARKSLMPATMSDSALFPYIDELRGRLLRAKGDDEGASELFSAALASASALQRRGLVARDDTKRIQWYLMSSIVDEAGDPGEPGKTLDLNVLIASARGASDTDYFADVVEDALLAAGNRSRWDQVETIYRKLGYLMSPILKSKAALIVARAQQLAGLSDASQKARFEEFSQRAISDSKSLYYTAVSRWMRGEPVDVAAFLSSGARFTSPGALATDGAPNNDTERVADGFWQLGMADPGLNYTWTHRKDISLEFFAQMGRRYVEAGRYRQGLKILESVRIRAGHPADQESLVDYYPRPYLSELESAIQGTNIPEWLMFATVRTESNFDPGAKSDPGATGLAQLMPATAALVAKDLGMSGADILDPKTNLQLGARYLDVQMSALGAWPQALAAYNAGTNRVKSWLRSGVPGDPILFAELLPFSETRGYVRRIIESTLLYNWLYYKFDPGSVLSLVLSSKTP